MIVILKKIEGTLLVFDSLDECDIASLLKVKKKVAETKAACHKLMDSKKYSKSAFREVNDQFNDALEDYWSVTGALERREQAEHRVIDI